MNNTIVHELINKQLYDELLNLFSPHELANALSFKDGLSLAYNCLYNDEWNEDLQVFSRFLLYSIRELFPIDWNSSWKYDALLGLVCYLTCKYEERYEAYKRAYDQAKEKPPGLLIALAECCICPGSPPISYDRAIELIKEAIKNDYYIDAVGLLSHIYSLKDDKINEEYWHEMLIKLKQEKKLNSPTIEPDFLVTEYRQYIENKNKKMK